MVQGGKSGGLAVIGDAASLFRGSLRAAGSRRAKDFSFTPLQTKLSTDEGSPRMKPKGTARKKNRAEKCFCKTNHFGEQ